MARKHTDRSRRKITPTDIPYFDWLYGDRWRPNGKAPISSHRECGLLLHHVAWVTEGRPGVSQPVKFVINTLDAWVMQEDPWQELDAETLEGLYCPGPGRGATQERAGLNDLIARLEAVKSILLDHYPDGKALGEIFRELNRAIASLEKWDGKPRGKVYREPSPRTQTRPQPLA